MAICKVQRDIQETENAANDIPKRARESPRRTTDETAASAKLARNVELKMASHANLLKMVLHNIHDLLGKGEHTNGLDTIRQHALADPPACALANVAHIVVSFELRRGHDGIQFVDDEKINNNHHDIIEKALPTQRTAMEEKININKHIVGIQRAQLQLFPRASRSAGLAGDTSRRPR